jgi:hypothetical protein
LKTFHPLHTLCFDFTEYVYIKAHYFISLSFLAAVGSLLGA